MLPDRTQQALGVLVPGTTVSADLVGERDTITPLPPLPHTYRAVLSGTGEFDLPSAPPGVEATGADLQRFDFSVNQLVQPIVPMLPIAGSNGDASPRGPGPTRAEGRLLLAGVLALLAALGFAGAHAKQPSARIKSSEVVPSELGEA